MPESTNLDGQSLATIYAQLPPERQQELERMAQELLEEQEAEK